MTIENTKHARTSAMPDSPEARGKDRLRFAVTGDLARALQAYKERM